MKIFLGLFVYTACYLCSHEHLSLTDYDFAYLDICRRAARSNEIFARFKSIPNYRGIVQNVVQSHGSQYLSLILAQTPNWTEYFDAFRCNDRYGGGFVFDYASYGKFAPVTLRYVKVASDIFTIFGSWDGLDIVEIGAGYGGQCLILSKLYSWKSYTIIDLPEVLPLIKKYLGKHDIHNVILLTPDQLPEDATYDLVISNFAFSECARSLQRRYLDKLIYRSKQGYMTCNTVEGSMTKLELTQDLRYQGFWCEDKEKEKLKSVKKKSSCAWVGTIAGGWAGNIDQISPFKRACKENSIDFLHKQNISMEDNCTLIMEAYMAPTIVGAWQFTYGYIPCRIFKNISYGQMGITNSARVNELFNNKLVYNPNTHQLFHDAQRRLKTISYQEICELMDFVRDNHTYISRIEVLLNLFKLVKESLNE